MEIIKRITNAIKVRLNRLINKIVNTCKLIYLEKDSYLFLQMAVKWNGLDLVKYNFGDDLNVYLFEELTGKKILKYDEFFHLNNRNYLGIGSILEWCSTSHSIIWGSGAMNGDKTKKIKVASVLALRGKYTKDYLESCKITCPDIFGDPALLLPLIYKPNSVKKKYKIGIVPHFVDYNLPTVTKYRELNPEVLFIDLQNYNDWHEIIDKFLSCEYILSSSLHGLIISDAYKIPNIRVKFSNQILGGDFKYKDYYSGIGKKYHEALDFHEDINLEVAQKNLSDYQPIEFNYKKLLSVFPFPITSKYKGLI